MSNVASILIIEDEPSIQQMIAFILKREGYKTIEVSSIRKAWNSITKTLPALIILDWMLPDKTGILFLTELKKKPSFADIPVIMLTARAEESSKIRGFDAGADDYITKPFSPRELVARVKSILKRYSPKAQKNGQTADTKALLHHGSLVLDPNDRSLTIDGTPIKIAPTEFKLLYHLIQNLNKTQSRDKLLSDVWSDHHTLTDRTVDVHIRRVRKILQASGYHHNIQSVRGIGYKFVQERS